MKKKSIKVNGLNLSYLINNEQASFKALVFIHGNSMSAKLFTSLMSQRSLASYQIIALDLPGHGQSEWAKSPEKEYGFSSLKGTICEFTELLGLHEIVLAGHSLGGHLCIQILPMLKERVKGLVIFGTPPLRSLTDGANAFTPSVAMQYAYAGTLSESDKMSFAEALGNQKILNLLAEAISNCDPHFRPSLGASFAKDSFENEQEILSQFNPKTLVLHGIDDNLISEAYLNQLNPDWLYEGKVHIIPQATHSSFLDKPEVFGQILSLYLSQLHFN